MMDGCDVALARATVSTRFDRDRSTRTDTIDHAVGRSSIVVPRATSIGSNQIDSIEVAVDRAIEVERAFESERRRAYLGDDGGARGDAFLRARGSRRERDQSGVQRQGNHDCVCVTSRVESRMHVINVIVAAGARGSWRQTDPRYESGLIKRGSPHPRHRDPLHVPIPIHPGRGRGGGGGGDCMIDVRIVVCIV